MGKMEKMEGIEEEVRKNRLEREDRWMMSAENKGGKRDCNE